MLTKTFPSFKSLSRFYLLIKLHLSFLLPLTASSYWSLAYAVAIIARMGLIFSSQLRSKNKNVIKLT